MYTELADQLNRLAIEEQPQTAAKPSWDEYVERGAIIRRTKDRCQWELGRLAQDVETDYGSGAIAKWASEAGFSKSSVYDYRKVVDVFGPEPLARYEADVVFFAHYRMAARLTDSGQQFDFLDAVLENCWSVDQAAYHLKAEWLAQDTTEAPRKLLNKAPAKITGVNKLPDGRYAVGLMFSGMVALESVVALTGKFITVTIMEETV